MQLFTVLRLSPLFVCTIRIFQPSLGCNKRFSILFYLPVPACAGCCKQCSYSEEQKLLTCDTCEPGCRLNSKTCGGERNRFCNRMISNWNNLPNDTVNIDSLNRFKKSLHQINFSSSLSFDRYLDQHPQCAHLYFVYAIGLHLALAPYCDRLL